MRHIRLLAAALLLFVAPLFVPLAHAQFASSGASFQAMGLTATLAATTSSGTVTMSVASQQIQVINNSTTAGNVAYVAFGPTCTGLTASAGSAGTATASYPVQAGAQLVVTVPSGTICAAGIMSASSATLLFTPGIGL